jgi:hypothetical protein
MYMIQEIMYSLSGGRMPRAATLRHKHVRLDQAKLDRARKVLGARTETETLDRALSLVTSEAEINAVVRSLGGKGRFKKVFR